MAVSFEFYAVDFELCSHFTAYVGIKHCTVEDELSAGKLSDCWLYQAGLLQVWSDQSGPAILDDSRQPALSTTR